MKMALGQIVRVDNEVPQVEVIWEGEETNTFYLSPFRGYGFQVSGGPRGEGAYGDSRFLGLKNVMNTIKDERMTKEMFRVMALEALHKHAGSFNTGWRNTWKQEDILERFIEETYKWVKTLK